MCGLEHYIAILRLVRWASSRSQHLSEVLKAVRGLISHRGYLGKGHCKQCVGGGKSLNKGGWNEIRKRERKSDDRRAARDREEANQVEPWGILYYNVHIYLI